MMWRGEPMGEVRPFFHRVESLRGIGAVIVAAWHVSGWAVNGVMLLPHMPWPDAGWVQNTIGRIELALLPGHSALMIFFIISGFVLRVSLQYGPQDPAGAAVRFHIARIFRIYSRRDVLHAAQSTAGACRATTGSSGRRSM